MRTGFYLAVLVVGALNSLPAAHASAGRIASLRHEALKDAVEHGIVVEAQVG